jgi:hypothetical protein
MFGERKMIKAPNKTTKKFDINIYFANFFDFPKENDIFLNL